MKRRTQTGMLALALLTGGCGGGGDGEGSAGAAQRQAAQPVTRSPAAPLEFTLLSHTRQSGIALEQNLVIKDAATFERLWQQYVSAGGTDSSGIVLGTGTPAPKVDFSRDMVLAVSMGSRPNRCHEVRLVDLVRDEGKIVAVRDDTVPAADSACGTVAAAPADLVLAARSDEPVEFVAGVALRDVDLRADSGVHVARNVVIRDQAALLAFWAEHAPGSTPPSIDFSREMLVGALRGQVGACNGTRVASLLDAGGELRVTRVDTTPSPLIDCIAMVISPAHIVAVKRSDKPVVFVTRSYPMSL